MDSDQTPKEPISQPAESTVEKRRSGLVVVVVALIVVAILAGGGLFTYQTVTTNATATAIAVGNTATAHQNATSTQIAEVTGTANTIGTATGVVVATQIAQTEAASTRQSAFDSTQSTVLAAAPVPNSWKLQYYEAFDDNDESWVIGATRDELGTFRRMIIDSKYEWILETNQPLLSWGYSYFRILQPVDEFYASVMVNFSGDINFVYYGLVFSLTAEDQDLYAALVSNSGQWQIIRIFDGIVTYLKSGSTTTVNRDDPNAIAVHGDENRYTLYVNGNEVTSFDDDRLGEGAVGVAASAPAGVKAVIEFDDFYVVVP